MLVKARALKLESLAVLLAALLIERDVLRFSRNERDVDLRTRVEAFANPRSATIDRAARQRVSQSVQQFARRLHVDVDDNVAGDIHEVGRLLAFAYPDRIALARGDSNRYVLASGRAARLPAAQAWGQPELIVVAELDAGDKDAKITMAAPYSREMLERDFASHLVTQAAISWDSRSAAVSAVQQFRYAALLIDERRIRKARPDTRRNCNAAGSIRELERRCVAVERNNACVAGAYASSRASSAIKSLPRHSRRSMMKSC